ncbi:MAG: beta-lactamase family protein [Gemmatimonadetes bacterium]|nr:beta-lactamase family protein [Gemmatimonadota bacterium]
MRFAISRTIALTLLGASSLSAQRPATLTKLTRLIDSAGTALVKEGKAPGIAVAVSRGGRIVYAKGFGYADIENKVAVTPASVFQIGSVTKQFTAAAILQLVDQGKLALTDPLTKFYPDWPGAGSTVTIAHLLNHTAGIHNYTAMPVFQAWKSRYVPADSMIALFKSAPFDFEPGAKWSYSNSGYYVLGQIVEKVSGEPYDAYVEKRLAAPNALATVRYCHLTPLVPNRAHGYASRKEGGFRNADYQEMSTPYAAGAICSTASDLVKWTMALESGKVVRPATYREMTTPRALTDGTKQPYAFGLGVSDLAGHRIVSHNGGIDGFRSQLASYPNDSLIIAVLVNGDSDLPDRFEKMIARWALGVPEPVVKDLAVPAELIARVTGSYAGEAGPVRIVAKEGKLFAELEETRQLRYQGNGVFIMDGSGGAEIQFAPETGRVETLTAKVSGAALVFKRVP